MDIVQFQNSQYPHFFQQVTLDNVPYKFYLDWNTRSLSWNLRINDISDVVILAGIKLVLNYELISRFQNSLLPQGFLFAIDISNKLEKIGRYDMDELVFLTYIKENEIESI